MLKNVKVNKKKVAMSICFIALLGFMITMFWKLGYVMGKESGRDDIVNTMNDDFFSKYNIYLVDKEPTEGRRYQMGSGKGFLRLPVVYGDKYLLYDYEDGKLVFRYDNIK